ncbi:hypothetical protein A9970_05540 [Sphingobacterium sp. UME9]|nr:hypothetical protein [Sphingobacterium sp. UME9]
MKQHHIGLNSTFVRALFGFCSNGLWFGFDEDQRKSNGTIKVSGKKTTFILIPVVASDSDPFKR